MAKTIRKHWDMALMVGFGLFLMIAAIITVKTAVPIPFPSVQAATTSATSVVVTATVSPTIEIHVSSTTLKLGTLSSGSISATNTNFTVKTNSGSGYTVTIQDTREGLYSTSASHKIAANTSASTTLTINNEGYGAQGNATTGASIYKLYDYAGTNTVGPLATTTQNFASSSSATLGDQAKLYVKASITATTSAGTYRDNITLTAVGGF